MGQLLSWAENFQSTAITIQQAQQLPDSGHRIDTDPMLLSADLWCNLNFNMTGATSKLAFDKAPPGNGFDAWRRNVTPRPAQRDLP